MTKNNRLTFVEPLGLVNQYGYKLGIFVCECGSTVIESISRVKSGHKSSCGCLANEYRKAFVESIKKPFGVAALNECYGAYQKSAKLRNYEFTLSIDNFLDIIVKPCIYCGDSLGQVKRNRSNNGVFRYTGIDRYDNSGGYTIENSVPCCRICNRIKTDMEVDFMKNHIEKMISNKDIWVRTA